MARQGSNRADLAKQLSDLETKKASLSGDLASLTSAAARAREDVAAAEGRGKAAQDAVLEAGRTLPTLKAQLSDVQADVAASLTRRDSLNAELATLQAAKAKMVANQSDADRATSEKATLEKAVADLTSRHTELRKELELRQGDLNSVRAELADLNGRKGVLVQEIAGLNDAKTPKAPEPVAKQAPADDQPIDPAQPAKP
jgi:chromosome segregation ATPase